MKFVVTAGTHRQSPVRDENGEIVQEAKNIKRGGVVESEVNLAKLFPEKYAPVDAVEEVSKDVEELNLEKMTVTALRAKATELEIDLPDSITKKEIIKILQEALEQ